MFFRLHNKTILNCIKKFSIVNFDSLKAPAQVICNPETGEYYKPDRKFRENDSDFIESILVNF